jgi:type IV pilus assembly protein PilQ
MNRQTIFKQLLAAVLWIASISLVTAVHASNMLEDISFASIPGDKVQVVMQFSESAPVPGSFTIDSPARIALDFPGTGVALEKKRQTIGIGLARSVTAVAAGGRTRVVISMVELTKYNTAVDGNKVIVTLDKANIASSAASPGRNMVKNVDFRLGEGDTGNIIVHFTEQPKNVNMKQQAGKLVVDMENIALPSELERRLDVNDFNTPVSFIDTYASGRNVTMKIDTKGEYDHVGYQAGNTFTIEVKGLTKAEKQAREKAKFGYTGERLSLNFQDIEVRAVLQLIADFTGKNMVTSDTVRGSITLRLKNVPWDQALDIILKTKGLGIREEGNVMRVAPAEELAAIEKQELEAQKQIANLLPLVTDTIQLQYVTASDVVKLVKKIAKAEGKKNTASDPSGEGEDSEEGASIVSSRATIVGDDRTNKLIVRDTARNITQLRKLIEEIDTPIKQVLIDARVVSASDDFEKALGLNWQAANREPHTQDTNVGINLGTPSKNFLGMTFGLLNSGYLVDLELSASQLEGTAEIVSSPRVVTTNGKKATIEAGEELPFQTVEDGEVNVEFKDAVLKLETTPLIIPGDNVFMDLVVTKDAPGRVIPNIGFGIDTREIKTSVLVGNGDTVVLGGIYERTRLNSKDSVPVLGDIPVIGSAFRVNETQDNKSELIIFITPKIMSENLSVR